MHRISEVKQDLEKSDALRIIVRWIELWVCSVKPKQRVVGNRKDESGEIVTQEMFRNQDPKAQVCPFVPASIENDTLWLAESEATTFDEIMQIVDAQVEEFVNAPPVFDPAMDGPADSPAIFKTFVTVFPKCKQKPDQSSLFEQIHTLSKLKYVERGLMLGQFYFGCEAEGIHNTSFRPLYSPYPLFVVRYMVDSDYLFNTPGTPYFEQFRKYFPS